ncbi:hypothetical protein ALC53_08762 [Atta colombica]|uniref:Uncharacterized protein n=1 Tax=Atta colombica TaxID=520822 RepID=A0A195B8C6_9HYME|nr:hypothetical protein ALC53_08762 [Atta colombica]
MSLNFLCKLAELYELGDYLPSRTLGTRFKIRETRVVTGFHIVPTVSTHRSLYNARGPFVSISIVFLNNTDNTNNCLSLPLSSDSMTSHMFANSRDRISSSKKNSLCHYEKEQAEFLIR